MPLWKTIQSWLGAESAAPSPSLEQEIAAGSARFREWLGTDTIQARLTRLRAPGGLPESAQPLVSDAACWVGESFRQRHGGQWEEHPFHGPVVRDPGDVPGLRFIPLAAVEKQIELGPRFDIQVFLSAAEKRIAAERSAPAPPPIPVDWSSLRHSSDTAAAAMGIAESFRCHWRARLNAEIPFTLLGVRELDGWLRSHYILNRIDESALIGAGFFVGEVTRGLFGGEWIFSGSTEPADAALHFSELDYFPIGRLYRQMLERPEQSPIDEYIRLVPSARKELRGQSDAPKETP